MEKRKRNRLQCSWAQQQSSNRQKSAVRSNSNFIFQETDTSSGTCRRKTVKAITKAGTYVISNGPSGEASVQFDPNFIPSEEINWMLNELKCDIPWEEKNIKVQGHYHRQPRLTAWFGDFPYTYSGLTLQPYEWSPLLNVLRERIFQKSRLSFNSMLANLYRDEKDSVDWHSDDEVSLGDKPTICSLSFGETRNFELRKKPEQGDDFSLSDTVRIPLPGGSLLVMSGATQSDWQHRVPKEYHSRGPRINLTFRNILPCDS